MPEEKRKIRRGKLWVIKLCLLIVTVILVVIDTRLASLHPAYTFIHFKRSSLAYSAFTFGVTFWSFLLAFPLALIRFRKLSFKHRYVLAGLGIMILLLSTYLAVFLISLRGH
jgi:tellurite resistance protein TehA-like permease